LAPHLKAARGDERILDIGCGDGKITAHIADFMPLGSVIGMDPSQGMLEWARRQYHPAEYPNLQFTEGEFLHSGDLGLFDLVVSFCALQHCSDQGAALQKAASFLKPGGKLLILVPAMQNPAWNQARTRMQALPRWSKYWEGFAPRKFLSVEKYGELLEAAGFEVVKLEVTERVDPFVDEEEIIDWLSGTFAPVVPKSEARQFYREWVEEYARLDPEAFSFDGAVYAKLGYVAIEARKSA